MPMADGLGIGTSTATQGGQAPAELDLRPGAVHGELARDEESSNPGEPKRASRVEGNGGGRRWYTRSELEKLRYAGADEQRRRWSQVYEGLGSVVVKEYDALLASGPQNQRQSRRKKAASKVSGEVSSESAVRDIVGNENATVTENLHGQYSIIDDGNDSSDDEYDSIRRPAFLVEGEPDFESGPPLDGLEYLRRVRWEAAQIPKVKVAKLSLDKKCSSQTPYMPDIPGIAKCPPNLLPSKDWEAAFLANFSETRHAFSWVESSRDQSSSAEHSEDRSKQADCTLQSKKTPTMTVMLGMDAVSRAKLLRNRISTLETASSVSRDDCLWLFSLCVAVDTPLDAEMSASFRSLLRKCSSLMAAKSELDDEVAMLSILVTIAGKYFGQSER